ncbi:hypothetical protein HDK90DRAFT_9429 [Phyllosticta capitalensis]|uniref:Rhodopsin domain-containing protein n=1 Tax=Phyllosticta capitalensis TaxID=121624 RepID=A0ABR1Z1V2_9PEZI
MSTAATQNYITEDQLRNVGIAFLVPTTVVVIARFALRVWKKAPLQIEDVLVFLSFIFFLALTICYIVVTPYMFRVYAVAADPSKMYPGVEEESKIVIKIFFCTSMLLWCTLWSVKFSLLCLYRRLMRQIRVYLILWWCLFIFCIVTFIGAIITNFTSCSSMHAWFTPGLCASNRDIKAQIASLYYAAGVDILSDLMIMALPTRLIWHLQMPRSEKFGIGALFCTGFVCVAVTILRVVQVGVKSGSDSTPSSSWLALWAIIEAAIAVFIGCCPAFAAFWRTKRQATRGYSKPKENHSANSEEQQNAKEQQVGVDPIGLQTMASSPIPPKRTKGRVSMYWEETHSSQEELAKMESSGESPGGIYVTRSIRVSGHHRPPPPPPPPRSFYHECCCHECCCHECRSHLHCYKSPESPC